MLARKSRKFNALKPLHLKRKDVSSHISKELKQKLKTKVRSIVVKKGDTVKVMRGTDKGKTGRVIKIMHTERKAFVEGIAKKNAKGKELPVPLQPSNLMIIDLALDNHRKKKLRIEG